MPLERLERWSAILVIAVFAALALPTIRNPNVIWREADGLMVARAFCAERAPLWLPRIGERGDSDGVTGMELPVLNWVAGELSCAGADPLVASRGLSFLSAVLAIASLARIARRSLPPRPALVATCVLAFSPTAFFLARSAQPDMTAVAFGLWSLDLLDVALPPSGPTSWRRFFLSAAAMAFGALVKLPVAVYGLPAAALVWERRGAAAARDWRSWLYPPIALAAPLAWYAWALELQRAGGNAYYNLRTPLPALVKSWVDPGFYARIYGSHLFDLYAMPVASGAAVLALVLRCKSVPRWWYALLASAVLFFFLGGEVAAWHGYYGLVMVPSIALLAGAAYGHLERRVPPRAAVAVFATACVVLAGWVVYRTRTWYGPPALAEQYAAAKAAADGALEKGGRLAVVSDGDPKVLWYLDRNGWVFPWDAACGWAGEHPAPLVLAVDATRLQAPEQASAAQALRGCGFQGLYEGSAVQVWRR